ncbi:hypothetical protein [Mycoplasma sp. P36-A1]|uniref:hypothetical protein n=1 Tax=Mycoplasma sp. P36-A1 TaxID=3252900 RepID=UPI003C30E610
MFCFISCYIQQTIKAEKVKDYTCLLQEITKYSKSNHGLHVKSNLSISKINNMQDDIENILLDYPLNVREEYYANKLNEINQISCNSFANKMSTSLDYNSYNETTNINNAVRSYQFISFDNTPTLIIMQDVKDNTESKSISTLSNDFNLNGYSYSNLKTNLKKYNINKLYNRCSEKERLQKKCIDSLNLYWKNNGSRMFTYSIYNGAGKISLAQHYTINPNKGLLFRYYDFTGKNGFFTMSHRVISQDKKADNVGENIDLTIEVTSNIGLPNIGIGVTKTAKMLSLVEIIQWRSNEMRIAQYGRTRS